MAIKLGNAPVSWGVDYADDPGNPPWPRVMDEIAAAGYRHTELGPYGYYPTEPDTLRDAFAARGLTVEAGFVFQPLHEPSERAAVMEVTRRTIALLGALGATRLVIIDHITPERGQTAGRSADAPRLDAPRVRHMIETIDEIADAALEAGITPVVHQHAGCYIEFEDEVEAVLAALETERVALCVDTGHLSYAGIDARAFLERHAARVKYLHFKEIDPAVHARVVREKVPFLEATARKVFCALGAGGFDWPAFAGTLRSIGYDGAATVEQDIDPAVSLSPLEDARRSLAYLRSVGF